MQKMRRRGRCADAGEGRLISGRKYRVHREIRHREKGIAPAPRYLPRIGGEYRERGRTPCSRYAPGTDNLKIDLHTHILPPSWPDLEKRYGYGGFVRLEPCQPRGAGRKYRARISARYREKGSAPDSRHARGARMMIGDKHFRDIEENCWDPERRLKDCKRARVDVQVLSTVPVMFSYWAKPKDGLDLSRMLNDHIASVVRDHPKRFVGLGAVPLQAPDLAILELERCVNDLGLAGVQIGSHVNAWNLDEPALFPFFRRAGELGAAVFVHPWEMLGKERMPKYWLPWLVGMPAETTLAVCSVIFGGVLERLPGLRLCFAHGGGSFACTLGRIERGFRARPDLCAVDNKRNPREYLRRIYVDSLVHDAEALRFLIRCLGADRVALGSDYPFPLGEQAPGRLIESMDDLTPAIRRRLLSGTALEFLGLKATAFAAAR